MTTSEAVRVGPPLQTITPEKAGIWTAALPRSIALGAPICITILVLAANHHTVPLLAAMLFTAVVSGIITRIAARSRIDLTTDGFIEHGLTGARTVSLDCVKSVVLVPVYDGSGVKVVPQFFALDAAGTTLLRMRGRYWSITQMRTVAAHLGVPIEQLLDAATPAELREQRGGQLYWFERHPLIATCCSVAGLGAVICWIIALAQYALH